LNGKSPLAVAPGTKLTAFSNQWIVRVADYFHYVNACETFTKGPHVSNDEALKVCKVIVLQDVLDACKPGISGGQIYDQYVAFGDDPFIRRPDVGGGRFLRGRMLGMYATSSTRFAPIKGSREAFRHRYRTRHETFVHYGLQGQEHCEPCATSTRDPRAE
jgi:hypothetical protein